MKLYKLTWNLNGKSYSEIRVTDNPQKLKNDFSSLSHADWPISDVKVE